jgi:hypothetical protein
MVPSDLGLANWAVISVNSAVYVFYTEGLWTIRITSLMTVQAVVRHHGHNRPFLPMG